MLLVLVVPSILQTNLICNHLNCYLVWLKKNISLYYKMLHFSEPSTMVITEKWYGLVHSLYNSDSPLPSLAQPAAMPHVADTVCHLQTCFPETQHHSLKHRKSEAHRSNKRYGVYLENGVKWCCHNTSFLHYFVTICQSKQQPILPEHL